jgi:hypothetical protein
MRTKTITAVALMMLVLGSLSAAIGQPQDQGYRWHRHGGWRVSSTIPAGTQIAVRLDSKISTERQQQGDQWTGTLAQPVVANGRVMIPEGSPVSGVITYATQGSHENRAQLDLAVRDVNLNGESVRMNAETESIIAGSSRAKRIGAIAGGAAAGALLGHAVGGRTGGLIGGLLGGGAGYKLTEHSFRSLSLDPGTVLTFTTSEDVLARRF